MIGLALTLLAIASSGQSADAQGGGWALPQKIPGVDAKMEPPTLVADHDHTVHALYSLPVANDIVIAYNKWTLAGGWTQPIDVLLSPLKNEARIRGAYLDQAGIMHIIVVGGTDQGAAIYYARALASDAGRAPAWSTPALIGPEATPVLDATLGGDDKGNLIVVYSGQRDGSGLYYVRSTDGGSTWSEPTNVFLTSNDKQWVYALSSTIDATGRFHVAWAVVSVRGTGDNIYYAHLEADHQRWSTPLSLAEYKPGGFEVNMPAIVNAGEELTVIYDDDETVGSTVPTRWVRRSRDAGVTWSAPTRPFRQIGANGHPAFLVDSQANLHLVFGNRIGYPATHGMWYSLWAGSAWSEPVPIVSGPQSLQFDPNAVQGVVSQGNLLFVVWRMDPALDATGLWYTYRKLNTREWPATPLPKPQATATPGLKTPVPTPELVPGKNTPAPSLLPSGEVPKDETSFGLFAGLIPVGGLLIVVVLTRVLSRR